MTKASTSLTLITDPKCEGLVQSFLSHFCMHVDLKELKPADHLVTPRGLTYTHHGMYLGNRNVIHYSGFADGWKSGPVEIINLNDFSANEGYFKLKVPLSNRAFPRDLSVHRARQRLGENKYSLLTNNCEHFVRDAIEGKSYCSQFTKLLFVTRWMLLTKERAEIAKSRRTLLENEYNKLMPDLVTLWKKMQKAIQEEDSKYEEFLHTPLVNMEKAFRDWDSSKLIEACNQSIEHFGGNVQYRNQKEFDEFMEDEDTVLTL